MKQIEKVVSHDLQRLIPPQSSDVPASRRQNNLHGVFVQSTRRILDYELRRLDL